MWSIGCIIVEILVGCPIFMANRETELMLQIWDKAGSPDEQLENKWKILRDWKTYKPNNKSKNRIYDWCSQKAKLNKISISENALKLITKLLVLDPKKRLTAEFALNDPFFRESPNPVICNILDKITESHEVDARR